MSLPAKTTRVPPTTITKWNTDIVPVLYLAVLTGLTTVIIVIGSNHKWWRAVLGAAVGRLLGAVLGSVVGAIIDVVTMQGEAVMYGGAIGALLGAIIIVVMHRATHRAGHPQDHDRA